MLFCTKITPTNTGTFVMIPASDSYLQILLFIVVKGQSHIKSKGMGWIHQLDKLFRNKVHIKPSL